MKILGINAFHPDSSACIVVDGIITSAVKESIEIECRTSQNPCRFGFIRCKHIISSYINKAHNKLLTYSKSIVMK